MANVLLTQKCVRKCPYCFAKEQLDAEDSEILKWEEIIYIADLLEISNNMNISLLGGEPTLHPNFVDFVLYLIERDFFVNIFTSGIITQEKLEELKNISNKFNDGNISFVCNLNDPKITSENNKESIELFLSEFGKHVTSAFNIYEVNFDLGFIFEYIKRFNLKKYIRIGLAHPLIGGKNKYVSATKLKGMANQIVDFLPELERHDISAGFDCGMPMCIFDNEAIGKLFKISPKLLRFNCGPAIDIAPDMTVWACFPLSNFEKKSLYEFDNFNQIHKYFFDLSVKIREKQKGVFNECNECRYLSKEICSGGCLTHVIGKGELL